MSAKGISFGKAALLALGLGAAMLPMAGALATPEDPTQAAPAAAVEAVVEPAPVEAAALTAEQAAQYASRVATLEERVAVLNRIVTDRNEGLAVQIESLRDTPKQLN